MPERICPVCGEVFAPRTPNQRFCEGRGRCYRKAKNAAYRSILETVDCEGCGRPFERQRGVARRVYCSDACHRKTKGERLRGPRTSRTHWPPTETRGSIASYKRAIRADPCAYCGEQPCNGIDHIQPTGSTGDRADWTNWIGCCKRCNETKNTLPLLLALPWIPLSRAYHDQRRQLYAGRTHKELLPHALQGS